MKKKLKTAVLAISRLLARILEQVSRARTAQKRHSCAAYEDRLCSGSGCAHCTPLPKWETPEASTLKTTAP